MEKYQVSNRRIRGWIWDCVSDKVDSTGACDHVRNATVAYIGNSIDYNVHRRLDFKTFSAKNSVFWDIMLCSPMKVSWQCKGTSPPSSGLNYQARTAENRLQMEFSCWDSSSVFKMQVTCSSETWLSLSRLQGILSQKMELFITTAVKTVYLTCDFYCIHWLIISYVAKNTVRDKWQ